MIIRLFVLSARATRATVTEYALEICASVGILSIAALATIDVLIQAGVVQL